MEPVAERERRAGALRSLILAHGGRPPVLDVGALDGALGMRYNPPADYRGLDLEARPDRGVEAFDLNSGPLPVADGWAGTVVCADVFEHVKDPEGLLRECARALAPGGLAVFSFPNERGLKGRLGAMGVSVGPGPGDLTARTWAEQRGGWHHLWYFTPDIAREFMGDGWRVAEERPYWGRVLAQVPGLSLFPSTCTCLMVAARRAA